MSGIVDNIVKWNIVVLNNPWQEPKEWTVTSSDKDYIFLNAGKNENGEDDNLGVITTLRTAELIDGKYQMHKKNT